MPGVVAVWLAEVSGTVSRSFYFAYRRNAGTSFEDDAPNQLPGSVGCCAAWATSGPSSDLRPGSCLCMEVFGSTARTREDRAA